MPSGSPTGISPADEFGEPGARAAVLLHGAVVNRKMWSNVGERLGQICYTIAPDLPGHGGLATESFRLDTAVHAIVQLLEEREVTDIVLVGESLGGYLALSLAGTCADRLRGLVLSGCTLNPDGLTGNALRVYAGLTDRVIRLLGRDRMHSMTLAALRRSFPHAPLSEILDVGLAPGARGDALRELAGRDFHADLHRLDVPVLIVNGGRDVINRLGERGFASRLPLARVQRVQGVAHGVALTCPAEFLGLVSDFTRRCLADTGAR